MSINSKKNNNNKRERLLAVSWGCYLSFLQNTSQASIQALLSRDEGVFLLFLCQLYILIAHRRRLLCAGPNTYSSLPWLYCMSEDRTCNILRPQNESTEISLWLVQIIPFGQKERNPLLSAWDVGAEEDSQIEAVFISIAPDTCGVCLPFCDPVWRYGM